MRVLIPLPDRDFDVTEVAVPWRHAPGMRQYLGSPVLQQQVARFWALGRPVGAICHGVLVLARTRDPATGRSVLADGNYLSARWPGDAYLFGRRFCELLNGGGP